MPDQHTFGALLVTAAAIGAFHALIGPDHYVPFIAMSRAGRWSTRRTMVVSLLCGLGHVGSSVALGVVGAGLAKEVGDLVGIEEVRGELATWLLIAFGFGYMVWGIRRAIRGTVHTHAHAHENGTIHRHAHAHQTEHLHVHAVAGKSVMTPWILFTIFIFGPCEPLIPLLMYPALQHGWGPMFAVAAVFAIATVATMMALVLVGVMGLNLGSAGLSALRLGHLQRYTHALCGLTILACGGAMLLGL